MAELELKSRQLETELDITAERLSIATLQLEEKEKQLAATELEMNALTRRVSGDNRPVIWHFISLVYSAF